MNSQAALPPGPYRLMMGISLAGPNLTPETFESGMRRTIGWYLDNGAWLDDVISGAYHEWVSLQYAATP